jgi:hypothetical protein
VFIALRGAVIKGFWNERKVYMVDNSGMFNINWLPATPISSHYIP